MGMFFANEYPSGFKFPPFFLGGINSRGLRTNPPWPFNPLVNWEVLNKAIPRLTRIIAILIPELEFNLPSDN